MANVEAADQRAQIRSLCALVRDVVDEALEVKRAREMATENGDGASMRHTGSLALLQLKEANRRMWELVANFKDRTSRAHADVDASDLKLQNLQYEKNHFLREIRQCRDFKSADRDIELVGEEDFAIHAPAELRAIAREDDAHQFYLNRLEFELQQRKALCDSKQQRLNKREQLKLQLERHRASADGQPAKLSSSISLSVATQLLLQQPCTRQWTEQRKLQLLPPMLRALFVRAATYRETSAPELQLSIVGDETLAASMTSGADAKRSLVCSPAPPSSKRQRSKAAASSEMEAEAEVEAEVEAAEEETDESAAPPMHPLVVRVVLPRALLTHASEPAEFAAVASVTLQFCCATAEDVLGVDANGLTEGNLVHLLDSQPAHACSNSLASTLWPFVPHSWVQALGQRLSMRELSSSAKAGAALRRFGDMVTAVGQRVKASEALAVQLRLLQSGQTAPPDFVPPLAEPPAPPVSAPSAWRELGAKEELSAAEKAALPERPSWALAGQRIFRAEVRRGAARLAVTVQLLADFPRSPPHFSLRWVARPHASFTCGPSLPPALAKLAHPAAWRIAREHAADSVDNVLLHMNNELNHTRDEQAEAGGLPEYALLAAMRRLCYLLDVHIETDGSDAATICGAVCPRKTRGRDRRKPFKFDAVARTFYQRQLGTA